MCDYNKLEISVNTQPFLKKGVSGYNYNKLEISVNTQRI